VPSSASGYFKERKNLVDRGLNENTNGLLRQYWPKLADFKKLSQKEVSNVIFQLNSRPRKILGYETPANLMAEHRATLRA